MADEKLQESQDVSSDKPSLSSMDDDELEEEGGAIGEWILTYSDLVTLLFAFFVLLFAMSSTQQESFKQLVQSLKSALGVQEVPEAGTREGLTMHDIPSEIKKNDAVDELGSMVQKEIEDIESEVRELIMFNKLGGRVRVEGDETGATITISDTILFNPGEATMVRDSVGVMKKIYKIVSQFSYPVIITGHTDNTPIHTDKYPSNWELSASRACEVVRFLISQGINPNLLSAQGFAEYRPIASNDTEEGRAMNRRVEIRYERQKIEEAIATQIGK